MLTFDEREREQRGVRMDRIHESIQNRVGTPFDPSPYTPLERELAELFTRIRGTRASQEFIHESIREVLRGNGSRPSCGGSSTGQLRTGT